MIISCRLSINLGIKRPQANGQDFSKQSLMSSVQYCSEAKADMEKNLAHIHKTYNLFSCQFSGQKIKAVARAPLAGPEARGACCCTEPLRVHGQTGVRCVHHSQGVLGGPPSLHTRGAFWVIIHITRLIQPDK